jgi:diguanylate cyclase (GGDEF)-like protein
MVSMWGCGHGAMNFDYASVLMAVGVAGAALALTFFTNWLRQRNSAELLSGAAAMGTIVVAVATYSVFSAGGSDGYGLAASLLLIAGFAIAWGMARQFHTGRFPGVWTAILAMLPCVPVLIAAALGLRGLQFVIFNGVSAAIITVTAFEYWRMRRESVVPFTTLALLYLGIGTSFFVCMIALLIDSPLHMEGPPSGWAEVFNLAMCAVGITGIGALTVSVHQERISRAHREASITDALTGLSNRRAVFDRFPDGQVPAGTGIIVFDLDDLKGINDRHGHQLGDQVLRGFADVLHAVARKQDIAARMGGEEFALVLPGCTTEAAVQAAEAVRTNFSALRFETEQGVIECTVSAGVALRNGDDCSLDTLLRDADKGLYQAKRAGRNRVGMPGLRVVA